MQEKGFLKQRDTLVQGKGTAKNRDAKYHQHGILHHLCWVFP